MALRKETSSASEIKFSIVKVTDKTNRHEAIYSEISDELSDFKNYIAYQTIQQTSENGLVRETTCKRPDRQWWEHTGIRRVIKKPRFLLG